MNEICDNPFRYIGVFANSTLKEQTAQIAQMKAYARVGQQIDNPLQLQQLLGALPNDDELIKKAQSLLALPHERNYYAAFWFLRGVSPEDDLSAIKLIDNRKLSKALAIWSKRNDPAALQNQMVAALTFGEWRQAMKFAQALYQHEEDIRRFVRVIASNFNLSMKQVAEKSIDNSLWNAVLKEFRISECRENIEEVLGKAQQESGRTTLEALYKTMDDLSDLKRLLGSDDVVFQILSEQVVRAMLLQLEDEHLIISQKEILRWFGKAQAFAFDEVTRENISYLLKANKKKRLRLFILLPLLPIIFPLALIYELFKGIDTDGCLSSLKGCFSTLLFFCIFIPFIVFSTRQCNTNRHPNYNHYDYKPNISIPEPIKHQRDSSNHIKYIPRYRMEVPTLDTSKIILPEPENYNIKHIKDASMHRLNLEKINRQENMDDLKSLPDEIIEMQKEIENEQINNSIPTTN